MSCTGSRKQFVVEEKTKEREQLSVSECAQQYIGSFGGVFEVGSPSSNVDV